MPDVVEFVLIMAVVIGIVLIVARLWGSKSPFSKFPNADEVLPNLGDIIGPRPNGDNPITRDPHRDGKTAMPQSIYSLEVISTDATPGPPLQKRYHLREGCNKIGRKPVEEKGITVIQISGDQAISSNHAYLDSNAISGDFTWENLDNSVWINDVRVAARQKYPLKPKDRIKIGDTILRFMVRQTVGGVDDSPAAATQQQPPQPRIVYQFRVLEGPHQGEIFKVNGQQMSFGRMRDCSVRLIKDLGVSRHHADLNHEGDNLLLKDAGSQGGLYINGRKTHSRVLVLDDQVKMGETLMIFEQL